MTNTYPQAVRDAADSAVCEYLENFLDAEIRDAVAGVDQSVPFAHDGKEYVARFYIPIDSLEGLVNEDLEKAVAKVIREMEVDVEEIEPQEDHSESETAGQSAVDCFVLVSDAPIPDYERVWNTLQEAVPVAQEIAREFGERVSIHASPDGGEHFDPKPVRTIGEG